MDGMLNVPEFKIQHRLFSSSFSNEIPLNCSKYSFRLVNYRKLGIMLCDTASNATAIPMFKTTNNTF